MDLFAFCIFLQNWTGVKTRWTGVKTPWTGVFFLGTFLCNLISKNAHLFGTCSHWSWTYANQPMRTFKHAWKTAEFGDIMHENMYVQPVLGIEIFPICCWLPTETLGPIFQGTIGYQGQISWSRYEAMFGLLKPLRGVLDIQTYSQSSYWLGNPCLMKPFTMS